MPIISGASAPTFAAPHVTVHALVAPSRGARETCAWRFTMDPGAPGAPHTVDREEVFVLLSGCAVATIGDTEHRLVAGDAVVVPPHTQFAIGNPCDEPLEVLGVLPVGARATFPGQDPFVPPWAR